MNIPEPTQTQFTQAEEALTNLMQDYSQDLDTRKGSAIRELLIRPFAYLYARIDNIISNWIRESSVAYLAASSQTSNSTADLVASNYFVTRKQGSYATGIVTLNCSQAEIRVNTDTRFLVDSHSFITNKTYIATPSPAQSTEDLIYLKMYQINGEYKTNVPVVADQPGTLEIPAGVEVDITSYIAGAESAQLLSPITGGSNTQTDAQMMARCKERCGAAIGTLQAIRTKMQDAPITVISCSALGSDDPGCFRSRYNNLALPQGGAVDIYAKTANQGVVAQLSIQELESDSSGNLFFEILPQEYPQYAGLCRISKIVPQNTQISLGKYIVDYLPSGDSQLSPIAARNTCYQKVRVTFQTLSTPVPLQVTIEYMPGIKDLQDYMDSTYGKYLGQSCLVKAAVPATVKVNCSLYTKTPPTDTQLENLKVFIAARINSKYVGDYNLNMDQIAEQVELNFQNVRMRLPYTLTIDMPMTTGGHYTFNTTDGTASLLYRTGAYFWAAGAYFYSTTPTFIELQVIS